MPSVFQIELEVTSKGDISLYTIVPCDVLTSHGEQYFSIQMRRDCFWPTNFWILTSDNKLNFVKIEDFAHR